MTTLGLTDEQKLKVLLHQYNLYFTLSTCNSVVVLSRFVYVLYHRESEMQSEISSFRAIINFFNLMHYDTSVSRSF